MTSLFILSKPTQFYVHGEEYGCFMCHMNVAVEAFTLKIVFPAAYTPSAACGQLVAFIIGAQCITKTEK